MRLFKKHICLIVLGTALILSGCKKDKPAEEVSPLLPGNFPAPVYNLSTNVPSTAKFELGRKLFYDPILSRNNTISCGSCHQQSVSFVHAGHTVSHGVDDKLGTRNTPAIVNMLWSKDFFWDGGVHNMDLVSPNPIHNPVEMDETVANVLEKLRNTPHYPGLFQKAFGTNEINYTRFSQSLSQFMYNLVSANSRYDKYVRQEGNLDKEEIEGLEIFRQKCQSCHATDLFTDGEFHNNGIQKNISDSGRYAITLNPGDIGRFKTPTLRNIEKTAPYMHNGKLKTLNAVLDHYATGIQPSATLDTTLASGIALTSDEKQKLILFLKTLTDEEFIRNPKFSEP